MGVEQRYALLLVPHVIAGCPHLNRQWIEFFQNLGGDPETARHVLDVRDDEVDPLTINDRFELRHHRAASGRAHDVADKKKSDQRAYSTALVSRITVTLIWPG